MKNNRLSWPLWLTVDEAAQLLRVNRSTVYEKANQGLLPVYRVGQAIRIDRDALFRTARKELNEAVREVEKKAI